MKTDELNSAIFVTARLRSSRLPEKMLIDIEGRPALWYSLNRMRQASLPDLRIVCTSKAPEDEQIAEYAASQGWIVSRGSEEDVLQRYLDAADQFGVDFFVNVDGDDLFCSVEHVDFVIAKYRETNADYISCEGLPFGGAPIGVKISALRDVCMHKGETETQGWGKYFVKSGKYHVETLQATEGIRRPDYRMTLDYPEDLAFFRAVVRGVDPNHLNDLNLPDIIAFLDSRPDIVQINHGMSEQYWERFNREHGHFTLQSV